MVYIILYCILVFKIIYILGIYHLFTITVQVSKKQRSSWSCFFFFCQVFIKVSMSTFSSYFPLLAVTSLVIFLVPASNDAAAAAAS